MKLTTHVRLMPRLRTCGAVLLHTYMFMAWCLFKHRKNFTVLLLLLSYCKEIMKCFNKYMHIPSQLAPSLSRTPFLSVLPVSFWTPIHSTGRLCINLPSFLRLCMVSCFCRIQGCFLVPVFGNSARPTVSTVLSTTPRFIVIVYRTFVAVLLQHIDLRISCKAYVFVQ
jgi:hypothetical protein